MKTPQEKQIEAYVETIAELNREVAGLKKINSELIKNTLKVQAEKRQLKRELRNSLSKLSDLSAIKVSELNEAKSNKNQY